MLFNLLLGIGFLYLFVLRVHIMPFSYANYTHAHMGVPNVDLLMHKYNWRICAIYRRKGDVKIKNHSFKGEAKSELGMLNTPLV